MTEHRYSFKLLEQHARLSRTALADQLRISHRTANHLANTDLTHAQADLYACRLGTWPWLIWPSWDTDPIDDSDTTKQPADQPVRPDVIQGDAS